MELKPRITETKLKGGDLIMTPAGHSFLGKVMQVASWVGLMEPQRYEHGGMIYERGGAWYVVEAWMPKIRAGIPLTADRLAFCDVYRVQVSDTVRAAAVRYALAREGVWYGYFSVLLLGLIKLWEAVQGPGPGSAPGILGGQHCIELLCNAYQAAGVTLVEGSPGWRVMPDELVKSELVERVVP